MIFPQTKTAQIHFPPKDSRRFRHGRASATEGVLKVLLQPAVQVHIWGGRVSTGTRFGYTARRQKRRHGPFPAPFSVSSILLFHLFAYPIDLTFCYSQGSSFKIEHGGHTEKTLVERLLSRKLIRVHFGLALLSHKHVDIPRRNHYFLACLNIWKTTIFFFFGKSSWKKSFSTLNKGNSLERSKVDKVLMTNKLLNKAA